MSALNERAFWRRPQSASSNAQQPVKPLFDFSQNSRAFPSSTRSENPTKLVPGTLASLTKNNGSNMNGSNMNSMNGKYQVKPIMDNDFPSLSQKKVVPSQFEKSTRPTFAEMSLEWSRKNAEEDEKAKKSAEEAAEKLKKQREFEELERRSWGVGKLSTKTDESKKRHVKILDIGSDNHEIPLDDDYDYSADQPPDNDKYLEEESSDEEADSLWNQRRHKNDL
jgi:hypothetical protein